MENNKTIGVFFGSRSPEHDISIITGQLIIAGLLGLGFKVVPVYLSRQGAWLIGDALGKMSNFTNPQIQIEQELKYQKYYLDLENSHGKIVFKQKGIGGKTITIDLAFPALHGSFGEDGTIQGLFEMLDVPYVGCDTASSAVAMDKALTKQICLQSNLPTTKFIVFTKTDWQKEKEVILNHVKAELAWPVFVKPVHLGSSIGIAKVSDQNINELTNKIEVAFYYDNKVLVEEGVNNLMDVTCCLIGNDVPEASLLQESVFSADLFNFEEKYLKGGGSQLGKSQSGIVIPATLDVQKTLIIQQTAQKVYQVVGCSGIARIDFLLDKTTGEFFVNEINPLPGTLYHHLWEKSGLLLSELLQKLLDLAQEKYTQKKNLNYAFQSSVLNNLGVGKLKLKK
ncbi:MAG: D-alanine--D-alanine ligase, partial [Candidatus Gribaldobacteria bacterium]|nr:D-alanine--D-alanine ligase [Candidatus Gribaldobacteria bacterium]